MSQVETLFEHEIYLFVQAPLPPTQQNINQLVVEWIERLLLKR